MEYYIIDRFEGALALCETPQGEMEAVPRTLLPEDAAEGDLLSKGQTGWRLEREATQERRRALAAKRAMLRKKGNGPA